MVYCQKGLKILGGMSGKYAEPFVFVQHGKSRLRQLWRWSEILASNAVIRRPKPGKWVVPEDLHESIAGLAVRVPLKHV